MSTSEAYCIFHPGHDPKVMATHLKAHLQSHWTSVLPDPCIAEINFCISPSLAHLSNVVSVCDNKNSIATCLDDTTMRTKLLQCDVLQFNNAMDTLTDKFAEMRLGNDPTNSDEAAADSRLLSLQTWQQGLPPPHKSFMTLPRELRFMVYRHALCNNSPVHQLDILAYVMNRRHKALPSLLNVFRGLRPEALHVFLEVNVIYLDTFSSFFFSFTSYELQHNLTPSNHSFSRIQEAIIGFKLTWEASEVPLESHLPQLRLLQKCTNLRKLIIQFDTAGDEALWAFCSLNQSLKPLFPHVNALTVCFDVVGRKTLDDLLLAETLLGLIGIEVVLHIKCTCEANSLSAANCECDLIDPHWYNLDPAPLSDAELQETLDRGDPAIYVCVRRTLFENGKWCTPSSICFMMPTEEWR